ncbi:MAG: AraC family transcriptional regulator [bacterium]|nr:AraC family transcriptional regulator [bacterium]
MEIKRYGVKNQILRNLIKYFWVVKADKQDINHKFLPVCNIDLVLNLGHDPKYITKHDEILITNNLYFNGITEQYKLNVQKGELNLLGISFFPTGLFPFLNIPLAEFKNHTIEFDLVYKMLNLEIIDKIGQLDDMDNTLNTLEEILLKYLNYNMILDDTSIRLFDTFNNSIQNLTVEQFSDDYGINKRRLERFFNKFIGTSPKSFAKIKRFRNIIRQLENNNYESLTDLAYENNYYDQMHFIKDFKSFTGSTPTEYINQKSSLMDIMTLV